MSRKHTILFRITDDELEILRVKADEIGVSIHHYAREMALTGKPPESPRPSRLVVGSVLHDPSFVKRLSDAQLKSLLTNCDPLASANAAAELKYRDEAYARLKKETSIGPVSARPEQQAKPLRPRSSRLPRHLQENNPQARQLARYMITLTDEELIERFVSPDRGLAEAAQREHERRKLGIPLFYKPRTRRPRRRSTRGIVV